MSACRCFALLFSFAVLSGCATNSNDDVFTLPKGNVERGEATFMHFRCYDCHRVQGVNLPPGEEPNQVMVDLGGRVEHVKDYGDLVTSIINPSHRLAKGYTPSLVSKGPKQTSRMTVYNDVMTVSQLIDIVAFLQSHYELQPYEPTPYPEYYNP
ncbi:MAG TPA: hypothetical protein VHE81_00545 [Lacipirellulaceae bacterium]|nr:hypothetical protein [Lacipirellulaceae bacterium]